MSKSYEGLSGGLTDYGDRDFARYLRRSFAKSMGYTDAALDRPIVGICYTASGFNNCHRHFPELLEAVKRGALAQGALPVPFPVTSLGEVFLSPTSMFVPQPDGHGRRGNDPRAADGYGRSDGRMRQDRSRASDGSGFGRQAGRASRRRPNDDRPSQGGAYRRLHRLPSVLGALPGRRPGRREISLIEGRLAVTAGTCAVMGTASTMALLGETLGDDPTNGAAIPAVHADRLRASRRDRRARRPAGRQRPHAANHDDRRGLRERPARTSRPFPVRPTPLSISPRSPGALASRSTSRNSTGCPTKRRCWSTSSRPAPAIWRISIVAGGLEGVLRALGRKLNLETRDIWGELSPNVSPGLCPTRSTTPSFVRPTTRSSRRAA